MIFGVLGPLEVAGAPAPGGPRQRALLALLVLRAGEVVPRDVLVEDVWGEEAPASAAHAVQVYVSMLRKALAGTGAAIESGAGGYRLTVPADDVDARRFARLAADGRRAREAGRPGEAAGLLEEALALWRGPALADFRYAPFAQPEIARLDELRLAAEEERVEALLELGRHSELVPELERLIEEEPLRERLRAQQMLALYRAGRQADALAAYREAARALRDELGLDPGPELRGLEEAILAHDPRLASAPSRVSLPAPATPLVGRAAEVEQVAGLLRGGVRIVTLTGAGGIGKTRLAVEAASRLAGAFPDGVHFAGLASVGAAELVAPTIAQALSLSHAGADALGAVAAEIGARRVLLVVDNFEHVAAAAPELGRLVAACPGAALVVTSRSRLRVYGEHEYEVPALGEADAVALFEARAAAAGRLPGAGGDEIAELCRRLDGLPLAIELAAAQSRLLTPAEMLSALPGPLELAAEGPVDVPARQRTLRATIGWSHGLLAPEAATAFRRLGVFAGGWEPDAAQAVAGAGRAVLGELLDQSLVSRDRATGRFRMLSTIREDALERLEAAGEGDEVRRRHAGHFLGVADEGDRLLRGGGDQAAALDKLEREHDNLRAALAWAGRCEPRTALRLAGALASFWTVRGHVEEGRRLLEAAVARAGDEDADLARALAGLGVIVRAQTQYEEARPLLERAAAIYRRLGDGSGLVRCLTNLGYVHLLLDDAAAGDAAYMEALAAARSSGSTRDRCITLSCLADLALRGGDYARVERLVAEGLELAHESGDTESVAVCLMNRAHAAFGAGRMRDALAAGAESVQAWAALGDEGSGGWALDVVAATCAPEAPAVAARLLAAADAARARSGLGLDAFELEIHRQGEREAGARLEGDALAAEAQRGAELSFEQAMAEALAVARQPGGVPPGGS